MTNIDPSAIIDSSAELDRNVSVGPYSIIGKNVKIASGTKIGPHVVIKRNTTIGSDNRVFQFASIGEDPQDKKYAGEETTLEIGDNNIFREGVTVHRGTVQDQSKTLIGNENLFMAYVHIAHDCVVGNKNVFANATCLAGHVRVGNQVTLGGVTLVHQFCSLGDHSFTGINTIITMDVPAFVKVAANPARPIGLNTVGMQRNKFDNDSINLIKKAYRIIYRKGYSLKDAIKQLHAMNKDQNPLLETFISSVESSERGLLR